MNDLQTVVIFTFGLLPLAIIVIATSKTAARAVCDRFLSEDDALDDEICLARISCLKDQVWRRIDDLDPSYSHGFPARPRVLTPPVRTSGLVPATSSQFGRRG
jgi:hypothetical protein